MRPARPLLAAALLMLPPGARAADCLGLGPAGAPAEFRVVRPGPRIALLRGASGAAGCPAETAACRSAASLGPGNRVVTGAVAGPYTCVTRTDVRGTVTSGWIGTAALLAPPEPMPHRAADWTGRWQAGPERSLTVSATLDGAITLRAAAPALAPDGRRAAPRRIQAVLRPDGDDAAFVLGEDGAAAPDDPGEGERCRMVLARRGPYLVVQDNGLCGAGFTALYRRGG